MKNIILFRHAEYNWNEHLLNNHDKPLNDSGIEASKKWGNIYLKKMKFQKSLYLQQLQEQNKR